MISPKSIFSELNLLAPLAVLGSVVSLCVGSTYAKSLFPILGAQGVTAYRVGFAAVLLLLFWRPWRIPLTKDVARRILLYGVTLGLMNLCFYMAIRTLPVGIAIAIEFTGPLALAMFTSRRAIDFLWIGCAVAGLVLLLPLGQHVDALDPTGLCFIFGAAFLWALYIVFGKRAGSAHVGQVTSLGLLTASCVVVPFGIAEAGAKLLSPHLILLGLAVALLSSAIPYSLEMYALKKLPKPTFGILLSTEPAVGAVSGWLILGETLSIMQLVAITCIMVASVGSTATIKRDDEPQIADADPLAP
jgi:inner membrane transporter RhtA